MIKVLIADDQRLMAEGLKTIIELEEDMKVVSIAENGIDAIEKVKSTSPDVILMDIRMPVLDGVQAVKKIKEIDNNYKILILTTFDEDDYIIDALSYGANGYMLKDVDGDRLLNSIRDIFNDKYILPSNIAGKLVKKLSNTNIKKGRVNNLTERENDVAELLSQGFTNKQIAGALFLSEGTIKNTVSNIYSKISISDRASAAIYLKEYYK